MAMFVRQAARAGPSRPESDVTSAHENEMHPNTVAYVGNGCEQIPEGVTYIKMWLSAPVTSVMMWRCSADTLHDLKCIHIILLYSCASHEPIRRIHTEWRALRAAHIRH